MNVTVQVGARVILKWLPDSVRADDAADDIFRECLGRVLTVLAVEENGDLELDVREHSNVVVSIFVPADCVSALASDLSSR